MYETRGLKNEKDIVRAINEKPFSRINQNLRHMLIRMYDYIEEDDIITAGLVEGRMKPDIFVEYRGEKHYISVKEGRAETVHQQEISTFVQALKEYGCSNYIIKWVLFYFYSDGTLDGTGERRYSHYQFRMHYYDEMQRFNEIINSDKELVRKITYHCLFQGVRPEYIPAEYIYFGTPEYGVICSQAQIFRYLETKSCAYMRNVPHIGKLQFRRHASYVGCDIRNEAYMSKIDFWWANLESDLRYITDCYCG